MKIKIYTDGACSGNPGRGGWAAILVAGEKRKEISAGYRLTTNNRMEILAVVEALEKLKNENSEVEVYSDSQYVCNTINKGWIHNWMKTNFKGKKNKDLWLRFYKTFSKHKVKMNWVKGHAGHIENERCDLLAVAASQNYPLLTDEVFEKENSNESNLF